MLKFLTKYIPLKALDLYESFILSDYKRTLRFLTSTDPEIFEIMGQRRCLRTYKNAVKKVPAYARFLRKQGFDEKAVKTFEDFKNVPSMNKLQYVKKYPIESRCVNGKLPVLGNIDESAGSSGVPTNWIRDIKEEKLLLKVCDFEFNYICHDKTREYIVLSAWSSGPWATGVKFCELMENLALVKNTETDVDDIVRTLKTFGPDKYHYLIAGYPPFLKRLMSSRKLNWKKYKVDLVTGGEGFVFGWRNQIAKKLHKGAAVISSYGASDIDIGIGFETHFCIFLRKLCHENAHLRDALFGSDEEDLPMIFQFNPAHHYISEVMGKREDHSKIKEYVITETNIDTASPKIRYNLHDEGGVKSFKEMIKILKEYEPKFMNKYIRQFETAHKILHLPFLFVMGRSDGTLSFDGANVYPHQIDMCLYSDKELLGKTSNFKMHKSTDGRKDIHFDIYIELKEGVRPSKTLADRYLGNILKNLPKINGDFEESYNANKKMLTPRIHLHKLGMGPFKKQGKIKNKYII